MHKFRSQKELDEWVKYVLGQSTFTDEDRDNFIHECVQDYHDNILMEKLEGVFGNNAVNMNNPNKPLFSFVPQNKTTGYAANMDNILPLSKPEQKVMDDNSEFDTQLFLNNQKPIKQTYIEPSYKDTPTIYNSPNAPEIKAAPKRPIEDIVMPKVQEAVNGVKDMVNNAVNTGKDHYDILLNRKVDYSKPMIPHEDLLDKGIKELGEIFYPVASDMYTDAMTDFSRAKENPNAEVINLGDIKDENLKKSIQEFGTKDNERGVHYNNESEASKLFSNSKAVKEFFEQNKDAIKQGKLKEGKFKFEASGKDFAKNTEKFERYTSVQNGNIVNLGIDDKGRGTGKLIDRTDYKQREVNGLGDFLNNHGYSMQEKGNLENNFSVIDILSDPNSTEEEVNNILEKLRKYRRK